MATATLAGRTDACGRPLTPANTAGGANVGRRPATKGRRYRPDPLTTEQIVALLAACAPPADPTPTWWQELAGMRLRAAVVVMWRAGLRVSECLALEDRDLDPERRVIRVRHGKGDKPRAVVMDQWGWDELERWRDRRMDLPPGPVYCVLRGPTAGRQMDDSDLRRQLRAAGQRTGIRRRWAPHQLRHTHAVELWRSGVDVLTVSRQLGHARLDVTLAYLRAIDDLELLAPIADRPAPVMPIPH